MRVLTFILLLAWLQTASQAQPVPAVSSSAPKPDVFLITIDTLRADHVGCYGYHQVETPALDGLATDGVRFNSAFTHSPITNTSHTTILTGLLPSVHGVTDFGIPLSSQHVTAAELLKERGYHTAAFIGAVILDSNSLAPGLDRGFDFYDNFPRTDSKEARAMNVEGDHTDDNETDLPGAGSQKSVLPEANPPKKERWGRVERRGMEVVEHAEAWFDKHRGGPHFVWVHLYDPHDPYEPPPPFSEKYKDHLYDGEIAYADSALAHWIGFLKKAGVYDNAIIVVTGDHGEGLGEHGEETHGLFLYDSTLHIPLIVKLPRGAHHGTVVDDQVRTTDILPTILSVTRVAAPTELNGESLLPLITQPVRNRSAGDESSAANRTLLGETDYPLRWGWAPLRALRTGDTKCIDAPRPEFYDLKADPKELKNLYASDNSTDDPKVQSKMRSMQAEMAKWKAKLPPETPQTPQVIAGEAAGTLPDPKDKVGVQNLLHKAMLARDDNRLSDARQFLENAVLVDPKSATAYRQLGELELSDGDFAKGAVNFKRALELRSDDSTAAFELGEALGHSGDWPGARDALESSLKGAPSQLSARVLLGRVYLHLKDARDAEDQFEAALLVESNNGEARLGLAEAQIQQSDFAGALSDLEALTKANPQNAAALRLLARAYRGVGREQDALRTEERIRALEEKR
jgi:arylsulfatase A-like enzyme/Tfp pilus assembly protein PilF